jgi:hypothetical protein
MATNKSGLGHRAGPTQAFPLRHKIPRAHGGVGRVEESHSEPHLAAGFPPILVETLELIAQPYGPAGLGQIGPEPKAQPLRAGGDAKPFPFHERLNRCSPRRPRPLRGIEALAIHLEFLNYNSWRFKTARGIR